MKLHWIILVPCLLWVLIAVVFLFPNLLDDLIQNFDLSDIILGSIIVLLLLVPVKAALFRERE